MRRVVGLSALGAAIVPPLFAITVAALTVAERAFLSRSGWSAVHRTPVEWPSLLALGPHGTVLEIAFVLCGALIALFGCAVAVTALNGPARFAGCLIAIAGVALALESFKADMPGTPTTSWHDVIHNSAYPLIPFGSIAAAAALSLGANGSSPWPLTRRWSPPALAIFVVALLGTNVDRTAQLARYFLFGAILIWLEMLALDALRVARSATGAESRN